MMKLEEGSWKWEVGRGKLEERSKKIKMKNLEK
jgi:hypothetical protein